jgi:phenylpropionate dioxygenase-like ring-hydroxylating dioxygenase large terminal subunit
MPLLDDAAVAERVLTHIRNGTTDRGSEVWREPVENYRSPERLRAEIEQVLRGAPTPFCPSAALPDPGSFVARDAAGTPVLVVRGADGKPRAFRNACRHRGTPVAEGSGCAKAFVCPYHAWPYKLDGTLQHVPHADGFPGLDREQHGLVPLPCAERGGLVFVTQEGDPDGVATASAGEELPDLIPSDQRLLDTRSLELDVNWKVFLEGFIEGYHIRFAHPQSFYPYGFDNLNLIETEGRHSRITYPFRRIEKLADVPPADRRVEGLLTYVYHLFPNALVTVLSRHTNLVVLEPLGVDRTRLVTYVLARCEDDEASLRAAKRDADFVLDTGGKEDRDLVCGIQRSLASQANPVFTFGHYEALIVHFHRQLSAALAEPC